MSSIELSGLDWIGRQPAAETAQQISDPFNENRRGVRSFLQSRRRSPLPLIFVDRSIVGGAILDCVIKNRRIRDYFINRFMSRIAIIITGGLSIWLATLAVPWFKDSEEAPKTSR
jgi:hypothetical protein